MATADLYPKLSLTGSIGLESASAGSLITADNYFYQLGPTLQWGVFDAGRIRQNIKIEDAITEQKLLAYQSAVLTALQEVEDAWLTPTSRCGGRVCRRRSTPRRTPSRFPAITTRQDAAPS